MFYGDHNATLIEWIMISSLKKRVVILVTNQAKMTFRCFFQNCLTLQKCIFGLIWLVKWLQCTETFELKKQPLPINIYDYSKRFIDIQFL